MMQTCVYLRQDRYAALADFITQRNGSEVPFDFVMPEARSFSAAPFDIPARTVVTLVEGFWDKVL